MKSIPKARLTAPQAGGGEITRCRLLWSVRDSNKPFVYIHAGAGYGKTTLLSQLAKEAERPGWLSLTGDMDIYAFAGALADALRLARPDFQFQVSAYFPCYQKEDFAAFLANAMIAAMEELKGPVALFIDDLHTIKDAQTRDFIACLMQYASDHLLLTASSREAPWLSLIPLLAKNQVLELTQKELAFTPEEAREILGADGSGLYGVTEGWPLALNCLSFLRKSGVPLAEITAQSRKTLYAYLFYECIRHLQPDLVGFLTLSAAFEELDADMLDSVLGRSDARQHLEYLMSRNVFIQRTGGAHYRYHTLFREYLLRNISAPQAAALRYQAACYYFNEGQFSSAAEYAMALRDREFLQKILLTCYGDLIKKGELRQLRTWFQALGDDLRDPRILVMKGAFLSTIGIFVEAQKMLDQAIPRLGPENRGLYFDAMVHKARALRNLTSFEASAALLDDLIAGLSELHSEAAYAIVIEKLFNLCWTARVREAYGLAGKMIEICARENSLKVKAWYERYLTVIHFFAGRMKQAAACYEQSLALPEEERQFLDMHNVGIYAAKAYQMMGERERSVQLIESEIQKLKTGGPYEELWSACLLAAEIYHQNASIDMANGASTSFDPIKNNFAIAGEYALLYRKTDFQKRWADIQKLAYGLMFADAPKEPVIAEIMSDFGPTYDYLKTITLTRVSGYLLTVPDYENAVKCAQLCIEIGERADLMLGPCICYGILARVALARQDQALATDLVKKYLRLCADHGIYAYFGMHKFYGPLLEFADRHGIEPEFARRMMAFSGYKIKKAYVETLGGFAVYPYGDRDHPIKLRSKRERELFAFLLAAGSHGATKEQIYNAIWFDSAAKDIKRVIAVHLSQLKKDLSRLGLKDFIQYGERHYRVRMEEIEHDAIAFETLYEGYSLTKDPTAAKRILSLYRGDYLADFEALWATVKRIEYKRMYDEVLRDSLAGA